MENNTIDFSSMIVAYNFVVGVLLILASRNIGRYFGMLSAAHGARISRLATVSISAFGSVVAVISGGIYVFVHILRFGL